MSVSYFDGEKRVVIEHKTTLKMKRDFLRLKIQDLKYQFKKDKGYFPDSIIIPFDLKDFISDDVGGEIVLGMKAFESSYTDGNILVFAKKDVEIKSEPKFLSDAFVVNDYNIIFQKGDLRMFNPYNKDYYR